MLHHNKEKNEISDCIMSLDVFKLQYMSQIASSDDKDIILTHLQRAEKIQLKECDDQIVIE